MSHRSASCRTWSPRAPRTRAALPAAGARRPSKPPIHAAEARTRARSASSSRPRSTCPSCVPGLTPRERALQIFGPARLGHRTRNGVLIYVLMADRDVEIVADRGVGPARPPGGLGRGLPRHGRTLPRRAFRRRRGRRGSRRGSIVRAAFPRAGAADRERAVRTSPSLLYVADADSPDFRSCGVILPT